MKCRNIRLGLSSLGLALLPIPAAAQLADPGASITAPADFDSGVYVPINDEVLFELNDARAVANGNAVLSFDPLAFDGEVDSDGALTDFGARLGLRGALTLEIRAEASGDFSATVPVALVPLPPFTLGDVVVSPFASASVTFSGRAQASGTVSVVAPFEASAEFGVPEQPVIALDMPPFQPELGTPEASASIDLGVALEVNLVFMVAINGIPIGGPALSGLLGIDLAVDALPVPGFTADLTTELRGGWVLLPDSPVTGPVSVGDSWTIASGALPIGLPSSRWSRLYDLGDSESAGSMVIGAAGEPVIVGNSRLGAWPWLAALDPWGVPSRQSLGVAQAFGSMNVKSLVRLPDGSLSATGWGGVGPGMRVQRYDAQGTPLWARTMRGSASTLVAWNTSVATASGSVILGGQVTYVASGLKRCVLAEVDASGAMVWMTEVDLGAQATSPSVNAIALTSTGEILVAGTITYQDGPSSQSSLVSGANGLLLRLSADGTAVRALAVGGVYSDAVTELAVFEDDSYAVGGYSTVPRNSGLNRAWVAAFEANDSLRWSGTYAGEANRSWGHINALSALPGGDVLVTGGDGHPEHTAEAWLFRLDAGGVPVFFKTFDGPYTDVLSDVIALDDGLIAFGHTQSFNESTPSRENDLWVVRASVDGRVQFEDERPMQVTNPKVRFRRSKPEIVPLSAQSVPAALTLATAPFSVAPASASHELLTW